MTAGQRLIEEGRQQERAESRPRVQGMMRQLLRQRFGSQVAAEVERRVAAASIEQVETWIG